MSSSVLSTFLLFILYFFISVTGDGRLFVIGDIGGIPVLDTTFAQRRVANALIEKAKKGGHQAVINLGDNFYFTGVMSDSDPRFKTRFEDVYSSAGIPWFNIAGNHDHFGSVQAQIDYSKKSRSWIFPAPYYKHSFVTGNTTIDLIMLDTIDLCGNTADVKSGEFVDWVAKGITGGAGLQPDKPEDEERAEIQWRWIEEQLKESRADYVFVGGHYPVLSIASHGPTLCLLRRLHPLFKRHYISAYLAGHDHSLQHIEHEGVVYLVSGAGSRSDMSEKNKRKVIVEHGAKLRFNYPRSSIFLNIVSQLGFRNGGFLEMNVAKNSTEVLFLNKDGSTIYSTVVYPRGWVAPHSIDRTISEELEENDRAKERAETL